MPGASTPGDAGGETRPWVFADPDDPADYPLVWEVLLCQADINTGLAEPPQPHRMWAGQWLSELREACATNGDELVSLVDVDKPWRGYLAAHAHAYVIIGMGVIRFEARFLDALEPNRRMHLPGPGGAHGGPDGLLGKRRFDFVVHRVDGTCVRLHPSGRREAKPVVGDVDHWKIWAESPIPDEASLPSLRGPVCFMYGHVDVFSARRRALAMIMDLIAERSAPWARSELAVDLVTGDVNFPWIRFLMGQQWGVDLMAQGIASMVLIWQGDPVIEVEVRGPPASRRQIRFRGGRATLAGP